MDCAGLQALGSDTESFDSDVSKGNVEEENIQKNDHLVSKSNLDTKQNILSNRKKVNQYILESNFCFFLIRNSI